MTLGCSSSTASGSNSSTARSLGLVARCSVGCASGRRGRRDEEYSRVAPPPVVDVCRGRGPSGRRGTGARRGSGRLGQEVAVGRSLVGAGGHAAQVQGVHPLGPTDVPVAGRRVRGSGGPPGLPPRPLTEPERPPAELGGVGVAGGVGLAGQSTDRSRLDGGLPAACPAPAAPGRRQAGQLPDGEPGERGRGQLLVRP